MLSLKPCLFMLAAHSGATVIASSNDIRENIKGRSLSTSCATVNVGDDAPLELPLGVGFQDSDCFQVAVTNGEFPTQESQHPVKLTIYSSFYGRFSIMNGNMGYAWQNGADGIYYCDVLVGDTLRFDEYPSSNNDGDGPIMYIMAELQVEGETCNSDVISYYGRVPLEAPDNGDTTEVYWSSHRYYLSAQHFEYWVNGEEEVVTMANSTSIEIGGDPGNEGYHSIEIIWLDQNEREKRFFGYIYSDGMSWTMNEARVYNDGQPFLDWVYFSPAQKLRGGRGTCFKAENLIITNEDGDMIKFEELTLATFLPWADEEAFLVCVNGIVIEVALTEFVDASVVQYAVSTALELNPFQVSVQEDPTSNGRRILADKSTYNVQITSNNAIDAERVHCEVTTDDVKAQVGDVLGEASILITKSSVTSDCPALPSQPTVSAGSIATPMVTSLATTAAPKATQATQNTPQSNTIMASTTVTTVPELLSQSTAVSPADDTTTPTTMSDTTSTAPSAKLTDGSEEPDDYSVGYKNTVNPMSFFTGLLVLMLV